MTLSMSIAKEQLQLYVAIENLWAPLGKINCVTCLDRSVYADTNNKCTQKPLTVITIININLINWITCARYGCYWVQNIHTLRLLCSRT